MDTLAKPLSPVRLRLGFTALDAFELPRFSGSLWRGTLGWGLRRAVCSTPKLECGSCLLRRDCPYFLCYGEATPSEGAERYANPPRPFVLQPPVGERYLLPGDGLYLDLVLLGPALRHFPAFVRAFQLVGEQGIGRQRHRARLEEVYQESASENPGWKEIHGPALEPDPIAALPAPPQLRLSLYTPLRLKHRGSLVRPEQFRLDTFLDNLIERQQTLAALYGITAPEPPATGPTPDNQAILAACLGWSEWGRWSQRQKEYLKIGGILGELLLHGDAVADYWEALWLGQWLNVGNATTFGMGRYLLGWE